MVTFTGTVTNDVSDTIMIRQPNGTSTPYQGPVPAYDYRRGDQVTISFLTDVPTSAYYAANPSVPRAADGIYRFNVRSAQGGNFGFGVTREFDVSGPVAPANSFGLGGITLVYDTNDESYSLEFPNGTWAAGDLEAPGYRYDAGTGALLSSRTSCFDVNCARLNGSATGATLSVPIASSSTPDRLGSFLLFLSGSWNLPVRDPGQPTPVPEPGSMLLFAGGAAWLVRRAKRRHKAV